MYVCIVNYKYICICIYSVCVREREIERDRESMINLSFFELFTCIRNPSFNI